MYPIELARQRHAETLREAERLGQRRRLIAARRWRKRAETAARRARLAAQAIR